MDQQNVDSKFVAMARATAPATDAMGSEGRGFSRELRSLAESLRRDGAAVARSVAFVSDDISSLVKYASSPGAPRLLRGAERLARRRPAAFLGAAFLIGLAILRILRSPPAKERDVAPRPPPRNLADEIRLSRHESPSGYFSARGEGTITNTPQTRRIR